MKKKRYYLPFFVFAALLSCSFFVAAAQVKVEYQDKGRIKSKATYKDGKLHGEYRTYYATGEVAEKGTYKDGERHGEYVIYHKNGNP